jgi:hypothetical protein
MKRMLVLLASMSANVFASEARNDPFPDQDLTCVVTSDNKRYEDIFVIEVREKGYSHLKYKRIHLASPKDENGNATYGELELVRGCYHGVQTKSDHYPERLSIECRDDGQEGLIDIYSSMEEPIVTGDIYFYMPQIGYPGRTTLDIRCERTLLN